MYINIDPLYIQIFNDLRSNIITGKWGEGFKLPSDNKLSQMYNVSRVTIRKVIDEMISENLVFRKKNKGCFINFYKEEEFNYYTLVKSYDGNIKEIMDDSLTKNIDITVITCSHEISKYLKVNPGEKAIVLKRIRGINGEYSAYFATYLTYDLDIYSSLIHHNDSLYKLLKYNNINLVLYK